jgi:hypothetical protein
MVALACRMVFHVDLFPAVTHMPTIEEHIQQKESEIEQSESKTERLRDELKILRQAARIIAHVGDRDQGPKQLSQPLMAEAALKDRGSEMHVKDIAAVIKAKFGVEIKPSYLAPVMFRQIGSLFYKSDKARNTFGLLAWQQESKGRGSTHHERIVPESLNGPEKVASHQ